MAHSANVARGTRVDATRHARPCGRAAQGGVDAWQGQRESTRMPKGAPRGQRGLAVGGPMG